MDRFDVEKQGGYEANYNAGWVTTQEDFVVFKGSRAEADVVVQALELLIIEKKKHGILGIDDKGHNTFGSSYHNRQIAHPVDLLESIKNPNYVQDVKVSVSKLKVDSKTPKG